MSLKRWNARRDANEPEIFRALRDVGALVLPLDKFDALVLFRGKLHMIDCKVKNGKLTKSQRQMLDAGWPLNVVRDDLMALAIVGALE